mmetsp:Transcript_35891/g.73135  ORF Transcript_35891/g.73135 Transcript_35891/m.73135 type:complete len:135 (-) Transcript_35891:131-535(-)
MGQTPPQVWKLNLTKASTGVRYWQYWAGEERAFSTYGDESQPRAAAVTRPLFSAGVRLAIQSKNTTDRHISTELGEMLFVFICYTPLAVSARSAAARRGRPLIGLSPALLLKTTPSPHMPQFTTTGTYYRLVGA